MLAIGRVLMTNPKLLILDEVTEGRKFGLALIASNTTARPSSSLTSTSRRS
jgi:ABC-type branched-subunit amino acid transport system ATPase component